MEISNSNRLTPPTPCHQPKPPCLIHRLGILAQGETNLIYGLCVCAARPAQSSSWRDPSIRPACPRQSDQDAIKPCGDAPLPITCYVNSSKLSRRKASAATSAGGAAAVQRLDTARIIEPWFGLLDTTSLAYLARMPPGLTLQVPAPGAGRASGRSSRATPGR